MSHIAVERNRRRQMNDHLKVLRALTPAFYIKRVDQASIIGGAIDFIRELHTVLEALEAKKKRRLCSPTPSPSPRSLLTCSTPTSASAAGGAGGSSSDVSPSSNGSNSSTTSSACALLPPFGAGAGAVKELAACCNSPAADVEARISGANVLLRTLSARLPSQAARIVALLESLHLEVLQVNISTMDDTVLHSFVLKIGLECQLSVEDLAFEVQQTFCCYQQELVYPSMSSSPSLPSLRANHGGHADAARRHGVALPEAPSNARTRAAGQGGARARAARRRRRRQPEGRPERRRARRLLRPGRRRQELPRGGGGGHGAALRGPADQLRDGRRVGEQRQGHRGRDTRRQAPRRRRRGAAGVLVGGAAGVAGSVLVGRVPRRGRHGPRRGPQPPRLPPHPRLPRRQRPQAPGLGRRRRRRRPGHPLHRPRRRPPRGLPLLRRRRAPRARRPLPAPALRGLLPQLRQRLRGPLRLHHHRRDGGAGAQRRAPVPVVPAGERRGQVHRRGRVPVLRQVHAGAAEAARGGAGPAAVGALRPARHAALPRVAGLARLLPRPRRLLAEPLRRLLPLLVRREAAQPRRPRARHGQPRLRRQARRALRQGALHALVARRQVAAGGGGRRLLQEQQEERVQPRGQGVRQPPLHHGGARHGRVHEQAAPQHGVQPGPAAGADQERLPPARRTDRRRERVAGDDPHQQLLQDQEQHPHHGADEALPLHLPADGGAILLAGALAAVHRVRAQRRLRRVGRGRRDGRRRLRLRQRLGGAGSLTHLILNLIRTSR